MYYFDHVPFKIVLKIDDHIRSLKTLYVCYDLH